MKKLAAQTEKLNLGNKILKKEYVRRDVVETEQEIKASVLMTGMNHVFRNFARDAIQLVQGDLKHKGYHKGFAAVRDSYREKMAKREKDFESQVDAYMALHKCSKTQAMQVVLKKDPDSHREYIRQTQKK